MARLAYGRMTNDPDVAAYDQYAQTVANEYAKIIGGAPAPMPLLHGRRASRCRTGDSQGHVSCGA